MPDYKPGAEVRITSGTGGQKGQKDARFGGGDPLAMLELARIYGFGEEKYDRYNYLKGYRWSLSVDALFRHLFAFLSGEDRDPESGLLHTAHAAWHALTLTSFILRDLATGPDGEVLDDRAPRLDVDAGLKTPGFDALDPEQEKAWVSGWSKWLDEVKAQQAQERAVEKLVEAYVPPVPKCPDWCCARVGAVPHDGGCKWCSNHPDTLGVRVYNPAHQRVYNPAHQRGAHV